MDNTLRVRVSGAVAHVILDRAAVHNALDETLAGNLTQAFQKLGVAEMVRVVVLQAEGDSFCAGADLGWLGRIAGMPAAEATRDLTIMALALDAVARCPKPVVAVVQGPALGLGLGLVAACDMAVAAEGASFAATEVRLGLAPSITLPYLSAAMGARACRRYALTGERFDAREALRLGLVGGVVAAAKLDSARDHLVEACLKGGPKAQGSAKDMLRLVAETPMGPDLLRLTVARAAEEAASSEGRDGIAAARDLRKPGWLD